MKVIRAISNAMQLVLPGLQTDAEERIQQLDDGTIEVTPDKLIRIASDVIELILVKNQDYGDAWQRQGMAGCLVRLADKLYRVETLSDGREALVVDEKIEDTLRDAIGYSMLGLLYLKEHKHDTSPQ